MSASAATLSKQRVCPRCEAPLRIKRFRNVAIDRCGKCGGVFFEPGESHKALGPGGDAADWTKSKDVTPLGTSSKYCPCRGHQMEGFRLAYEEERLEVDVCLHCRGVWLDRHEARQLHIVVKTQRAAASGAVEVSRGLLWLNAIAGMPVEEHNPAWRRTHWVTLLIVLLIAIYVTEILLLREELIEVFTRNFALIPAQITRGEAWWTLLTSMFVHAGIVVAVAVFVFLKVFGDNVEDKLGGGRLLAIFLLSGLAGAAAHVIVHPRSEIPILGADAALAGVIGAYVVMFPHVRIRGFFSARLTVFSYALIWVVAHLVAASIELLELVPSAVPWFAHLAGFATGLAISLHYRARRLRMHTRRPAPGHGR